MTHVGLKQGTEGREVNELNPCDHNMRNHLHRSNTFYRIRRMGVSNSVHPLQTKRCLFLASLVHGVEGASDDEAADLTRAGADFVQLGVPEESTHGVVVDVAVPTC